MHCWSIETNDSRMLPRSERFVRGLVCVFLFLRFREVSVDAMLGFCGGTGAVKAGTQANENISLLECSPILGCRNPKIVPSAYPLSG